MGALADWYCSSVAYAAIPVWQATHAYVIGNIIRPTVSVTQTRSAYRCTTAGTSAGTEPANWNVAGDNNSTIASGGATFTNVTGQSTYGWAAAAGDLQTLNGTLLTNRYTAGDRTFVSSDHAETSSSGSYGSGSAIAPGYGLLQFICVNRAGSVPPVAADVTTGAVITTTIGPFLYHRVNVYCYGITFTQTNGVQSLTFNDNNSVVQKTGYYQACQFNLDSGSTSQINANNTAVVFDNTAVSFGAVGQKFNAANWDFTWVNTASAIGGTAPTVLFNGAATNLQHTVTLRGVDLSAVTGTLVTDNSNVGNRYLLDSCKIASGVTRYTNVAGVTTVDIIELVNCYDGTHILSESYQVAGTLTTEFTITLSGGATDDVGTFSHKIVTDSTNIDKFANTFKSFWMDVENTSTGSPKTATVEIISSTALNNDEIALFLEYEGTAGSSVASFGNSFITTPLTTAAAVTTSSATWNSSPATPAKQKCQVTFTPQHAGRLRGQIRLGKASATVYVNPQITVS